MTDVFVLPILVGFNGISTVPQRDVGHTVSAISRYRQNEFANSICRGVLHCTSNNAGLATSTVTHCAREVATFNLFPLYKNSIPRGASCGVEVAIE